ncbi:MAG: hypothetical protein AB1489_40300 [Acidobacteriota bacterium]
MRSPLPFSTIDRHAIGLAAILLLPTKDNLTKSDRVKYTKLLVKLEKRHKALSTVVSHTKSIISDDEILLRMVERKAKLWDLVRALRHLLS